MQSVQERTKDQLGETLSLCRVSLGAYCAAMLPNFQTPPHVQLIIRKLEMLEAGIIGRLIICLPPRCGKTMAAQMAMAWTMGRDPTRSIIASGYAQELADDTGRRVRNLLNSAMHQAIFPGCRLAGDSQAMQRFATTANGAFYAAGRGASITGRGADFLLLDDMLKDYEEACSQAIRKGVWDWFQSVAYPRLEPGGRVLVIGTRWATSDLIGQILAEHKGEGWELVSLPALAEPGDVLGRPEGAPIWPERYDREALESIKRQIGGRMFASLYMQDPVMSSGNLFRRNWWRYYREAPQEGRLVLSLDSAFKTGKENDFSAWTLWRAAKDGYYLLHAGRDRLEFPELKRMLNNLAAVWHPHLLLVEDAASGQSLLQELRRDTALPLKAIRPDKDKLARAAAITPLIECGRTYLPEAAPWLEDYLDELSAFPSGAHDDWTDSTTQFLNYVRVVQPGAVTINFWTGSGRSLDWGEYSAMDWVSWQLWQSAR